MCVYCVYLLCIKTHTYSIYFENIYMYLHVYIYIIYKYFQYINNVFFLNIYMHMCLDLYIYIIYIHILTDILCKQKLLFFM